MEEREREPIALRGGGGEGDNTAVDEFLYLGSLIASSGEMDVDGRMAQARRVFRALRKVVIRS